MAKESNRMRRILAVLIDLMAFYIPCILFAFVLQLPFLESISILVIFIIDVTFFVAFILRDYLFRGRSIGKRIFKLRVLNTGTLSIASTKQLVVKNLFFFLYPIDALFLVITGRSLGERATGTTVLREHQFSTDSSDSAKQSKESVKKRIAVAVFAVLCISVPMFLIVSMFLNSVKKQENYQVAYAYLVSSDAFAEMQAEESQTILTGYSSSTQVDKNGDATSADAIFTFVVKGQRYQVVCHQDSDMWYVCGDCTAFQ